MGGWKKRANVVPQNSGFNDGVWRSVEEDIGDCLQKLPLTPQQDISVQVSLDYPDNLTNTPDKWTLYITIGGRVDSAEFDNAAGGGPQGEASKNELNTFIDQYCN